MTVRECLEQAIRDEDIWSEEQVSVQLEPGRPHHGERLWRALQIACGRGQHCPHCEEVKRLREAGAELVKVNTERFDALLVSRAEIKRLRIHLKEAIAEQEEAFEAGVAEGMGQ